MIEADVSSTQNEFHTYALNWTSEALTWLIDDKPMRTLKYADANGGKNFPQTPCNVRLGNWPAGDSKDEGTVSWAGGKVDYTKGAFNMTVASIKVTNYSPGTEYHFKDKSGSFESIEVVGAGNKDGAPQNTAVLETSATASGAPFESGFAAPSATGGVSNGTSTTCTEGQAGATPAPSNPGKTTATAVSGGQSDFNYPVPTGSGSKPVGGSSGSGNGNDTVGEAPCDCGTATTRYSGSLRSRIFPSPWWCWQQPSCRSSCVIPCWRRCRRPSCDIDLCCLATSILHHWSHHGDRTRPLGPGALGANGCSSSKYS